MLNFDRIDVSEAIDKIIKQANQKSVISVTIGIS